jgi:hypothetical protein
MGEKNSFYPGSNDENLDRDKEMKEQLGAEISKDDLSYDEETDSFELDVASNDEDYDHPDPYNTAVKSGSDFDSDYDEANVTAVDEYRRANDVEVVDPAIEEFGMHIDSGKIVELDPIDEELAHTPEDDRDDLDEEGYPKNDESPDELGGNEYLK